MKLTINLGDELKHAKVSYPINLPVTKNGEFIGEARIQLDGTAEITIGDRHILNTKDALGLGVGGTVTSRKGDTITGFDIEEVSIQFKGDGLTVPNKRFSITKTILSDFSLFAIIDNEQNKVVCHMVYDNGEEYCDEMANKMLEGLNGR